MTVWNRFINMAKLPKKFKAIEKNPINAPVKENLEWEGEEVGAESTTKIEEDKGTGQTIIMRFFEFSVNPQTFKDHKPTAQELFDSHRRGMEALLWSDGLTPHHILEPRLQFSKDKTRYRFVLTCIPSMGNVVNEKTQTLSEILK